VKKSVTSFIFFFFKDYYCGVYELRGIYMDKVMMNEILMMFCKIITVSTRLCLPGKMFLVQLWFFVCPHKYTTCCFASFSFLFFVFCFLFYIFFFLLYRFGFLFAKDAEDVDNE
jgi:hypothetical protein